MDTAAQPAQDNPELYHLQHLADELAGHGWQCAPRGTSSPDLPVTNPNASGLNDRVVCRPRDDGFHYAFHWHRARTLGHVDRVAEVAQQIVSILGPVEMDVRPECPS